MPIANSLHVSAIPHDVCLETFCRKSYTEPEEKLMLAVLDNAIACFQKYAFACDRKGKILFQEAQDWVQETNSAWLFSFVNVCGVLGFHPDYLRRGLDQWKAAKLENRPKPRSATIKTQDLTNIQKRRRTSNPTLKSRTDSSTVHVAKRKFSPIL